MNWQQTKQVSKFFGFLRTPMKGQNQFCDFLEPPIKGQHQFFDFESHQSRAHIYLILVNPSFQNMRTIQWC